MLVGWGETGRRPEFDIVTGVSTGALIAPLAFLGRAYDKELTELYTSGIARDFAKLRFLPAALLGSSFFDPKPLRRVVERFVDQRMLKAVADARRKGRLLYVVTTNLNAQRPVLWDLGLIAESNRPEALELFQNVLIASASIPAIYPPVAIGVEIDKKPATEMDVDGGTAMPVFVAPDTMLAGKAQRAFQSSSPIELYVLVNSVLFPVYDQVEQSTLSIGARGRSTLLKAQMRSSVMLAYTFAKRSGIHFNISSISGIFTRPALDPFNPVYMRGLYNLGYQRGLSQQPWRHDPLVELGLSQSHE